ncbi:peptidylprolyl isomerase [Caulobacter endophyticus]|uniref:Peptidylprolyl isomerase n=1 Tax=Caulobacter endophyticus TaxID=2172652 RepID=A0A2T9JTW4_9CAUL|nr:peptidylprolyl isomerase [Caulobacter endophyticus]PVM87140.1 peptidylprolyl isomerase [Caulobacter endophyticus]
MTAVLDVHRLHAGVAEAGKVLALKGRHDQALAKYREALRLAHGVRAPQIFARHYLHCVLESLERTGANEQAAVLAHEAACSAAAELGDGTPSDFQRRDRACLLERCGVNRLKAGDTAGARESLEAAIALDEALPLSRDLLAWTARGLGVPAARLAEAQRVHGYWTVRADTVDRARACDSPALMKEPMHG